MLSLFTHVKISSPFFVSLFQLLAELQLCGHRSPFTVCMPVTSVFQQFGMLKNQILSLCELAASILTCPSASTRRFWCHPRCSCQYSAALTQGLTLTAQPLMKTCTGGSLSADPIFSFLQLPTPIDLLLYFSSVG